MKNLEKYNPIVKTVIATLAIVYTYNISFNNLFILLLLLLLYSFIKGDSNLETSREINICIIFGGIFSVFYVMGNYMILLENAGLLFKIVKVTFSVLGWWIIFQKLLCILCLLYTSSICAWGPTALLPVFQLLGVEYTSKVIISNFIDKERRFDGFTKIEFVYPNAVASLKVGKGVKSEGELIISGTKGYIYVPAPWWKTDYFEIRYENPEYNKRYFYQLEGEGIRYELVAFIKSIETQKDYSYIDLNISKSIIKIMSDFEKGIEVKEI